MSITASRRLGAVVTACLLAAGTCTATADAAKRPTAKSVDKKVNRTNKSLSKTRKSLSTTQANLKKTDASLATANGQISAAAAQISAATGRLTTAEGQLAGILAAAPQLANGLTTLADAVQNQIAPGLKTLADAVQNQIAPGLQTLGDAYKAVEYGRAAVVATGAPATAAGGGVKAGGAVTSADIPDDGNTITAGDTAYVVAAAPGTMTLDLRASIRSAESDGDVTTKTAGQAGGFLTVEDAGGALVACDPPIGGPIDGTQPGDSIVTPGGTVTNLPLKNIPGGTLRTDTTDPANSLLPVACSFTVTPGTLYRVKYSVNFVDIPTSTTPGPKE